MLLEIQAVVVPGFTHRPSEQMEMLLVARNQCELALREGINDATAPSRLYFGMSNLRRYSCIENLEGGLSDCNNCWMGLFLLTVDSSLIHGKAVRGSQLCADGLQPLFWPGLCLKEVEQEKFIKKHFIL
jgi:hypothetical protein